MIFSIASSVFLGLLHLRNYVLLRFLLPHETTNDANRQLKIDRVTESEYKIRVCFKKLITLHLG